MSRWWRAYDEAVDDPKLQRLGARLGWAWFNLMCIASKNDGYLPPIGDIAFKLRVSEQQAAATITALVSAGLFDKQEDGRFAPHNWNARQFKSDVSTDRVKRFRKRERNVSSTVSETAPETETETETEQRQKDSEPDGSGAEAPPDPSEPERQLFVRGREILGKSAGGQIAKLLNICGHNVALARSKIELSATKQSPSEFVAAVIRAGPSGRGTMPARPLTQHQIERENSRKILDDLGNFANSGGESQADIGLLRLDPGDGPEGIHRGVRGAAVDLSPSRSRQGG